MSEMGQSRRFDQLTTTSGLPRSADINRPAQLVRSVPILLQKSKVASVRIFGETLKREAIDDSDNLSRVTEVANEFIVRRCGPSGFYTKTAPTALRIFDTFSKTTFATLSAQSGPDLRQRECPLSRKEQTSTFRNM
jgi:hypothetical protein